MATTFRIHDMHHCENSRPLRHLMNTDQTGIYNDCMLSVSFSHKNVLSHVIFCLSPLQQWPDPTMTSSCDRNTLLSPLLCPSNRSSCWLSPSVKPPPSGTTSADWHPSRSKKRKITRKKKICGEKQQRRRKRRALCSCLNRPFLIIPLFSFLLVTLP